MTRVDYFKNHDKFQTFKAGEIIFDQNQPGEVMYGVKEGEIDIRYNGQVLETVTPGHFFGEMSLIDAMPRSAQAVARTDCKLVPVDERQFLYLVQETPTFALQVMQALAERLRALHEKI